MVFNLLSMYSPDYAKWLGWDRQGWLVDGQPSQMLLTCMHLAIAVSIPNCIKI